MEAQVNDEEAGRKLTEILISKLQTREQRDEAAIPQRVDQLEDATMNLAGLFGEVKESLGAHDRQIALLHGATAAQAQALEDAARAVADLERVCKLILQRQLAADEVQPKETP